MYNTEAALSLTLDTPPPDLPASVTFSGYATANINDIAQTFAPDAPVGSDTISGNTTARWELSRSGDTHSLWAIGNPQVESAAGRNYVLADDSSTPAATTFVANASINLIGNTNAVFAIHADVQFTYPNFSIIADGTGSDGFTRVLVNGNSVTLPSSGSFTQAGVTVTYSASTTSVLATASAPLSALPTVSRGVPGDPNYVKGIAMSVGTRSSLSNTVSYPGQPEGVTTLTTHYDAHFEDTPTP